MKSNYIIIACCFSSLCISSCIKEGAAEKVNMMSSTSMILAKDRVNHPESPSMAFDVCNDPPGSTLYLYSFGTTSFYITPKLDGSAGSESITAGSLSCFYGPYGYTCDGPSYSGACCFTINSSLSCLGSVYQVLDNQVYTITPYVSALSPCFSSSFTFEIVCDDEVQSIRFCSNECFFQMCYGLNCFNIDINN